MLEWTGSARLAALTLAVWGAWGCEGLVTRPGGERGTSPGEIAPSPSTRFHRLNHDEWEHTVQDLFELDAPPGSSGTFRSDPRAGGFLFDNDGSTLEVDPFLWSAYQAAAESVTDTVVDTPTLLDPLLPATGGSDLERARTFIAEFGQRAHRRPLSNDDIAGYVAVYEAHDDSTSTSDAFHEGIRAVINAMLQSPYFLYRTELSTAVAGEVIPLDGFEIASRLSYFLWRTMPDAELFEAAATGALLQPPEVERQARRMLADPRAEEVVVHFHEQLLDVEEYSSIAPSPTYFPDVDPALGDFATTEHALFVAELVFRQDGTWADLLTSTETFVNRELARIYGLEGDYGDTFERASLDPSQRRGLFTQVGFLAHNATTVDPDPIHRGAFLARRVACMTIAAPPDMVPPVPAPGDQTNREAVEEHTEAPGSTCASCHRPVINPWGFPYEMFDAVGAHRTEDNGHPVDTRTRPLIGENTVAVDDALELADAMASADEVHACYAQHWLEFALGRPSAPTDRGFIFTLGQRSVAGELSVQDLLVAIASSESFMNRSTQELP